MKWVTETVLGIREIGSEEMTVNHYDTHIPEEVCGSI